MTSTFAINDSPSIDNANINPAPVFDSGANVGYTPNEEIAPAEPTPAPAGPSEIDELKQRLAELEPKVSEYEKQRQDEQARAQQAQAQQRDEQVTAALTDWHSKLTTEYGMPADEAGKHVGLLAQGVEYQQKAPWLAQTVARDMAHQEAMTALGPDATVAQVQAAAQMLMQYTDPRSLRAAAQQLGPVWKANRQALTAQQQGQLRQQVIDSGATRVEGGQRAGTGGGMGDQELVNGLVRGQRMEARDVARARDAMARGIYPTI